MKGFLERLKANEDCPDRQGYESDKEAYQEDWIDDSSVEVLGSRFDDCDEGKQETCTVVGEMLHGPTFGETYEEESKEVKHPA